MTEGSVQNGLTESEEDRINEVLIDINMALGKIYGLPNHRSLSLAVTKLQESQHWLRDRLVTPS
ncbi:MAG: hypothetical protein ACR2QF_07290 [Geminicoccaceae bacterium]